MQVNKPRFRHIALALVGLLGIFLTAGWNLSISLPCEEQSTQTTSDNPEKTCQSTVGQTTIRIFILVTNKDYLICWFTGFLAVFTYLLFRSTEGLLRHAPQVERAYISGGGEARSRDGYWNGGHFRVDINNYGKTPGYAYLVQIGYCTLGELWTASVPIEFDHEENWGEWLTPGTISRPTVFPHIPKSDGGLIVFGRIHYEDIFGQCHSSGFILRVKSDGTTEPQVAPTSEYTEERDEKERRVAEIPF